MLSYLSSLFGTGVPDLSQVTAAPGMGMGQLGTSLAGMNVSSDFAMQPGMNMGGMLGALGGIIGDGQQAPMMPPAPVPVLQAGGEQFAMPYQQSQGYQPRPTSQALSGLLGNIYGNF